MSKVSEVLRNSTYKLDYFSLNSINLLESRINQIQGKRYFEVIEHR